MKTKLLLFVGFLGFFGMGAPAFAASNIIVQILGPATQSPQNQSRNACFQAAAQMKAAGLSVEKRVMKKENISLLPNDLIYDVYTSEKGSDCALLNFEESQASTWGQQLPQIAGCICNLKVPIKD